MMRTMPISRTPNPQSVAQNQKLVLGAKNLSALHIYECLLVLEASHLI